MNLKGDHFMKKIITFLIAVSMMTAVFSCSDNNNARNNSMETSVAEQIYFKEAEITMSDDFSSIISIDKYDDRVLVFGKTTSENTVGYLTDTSFSEYEILDFKPKSGEIVKSACLGKFDRTAVLTYLDGKTFLYVFDRSGNIAVESDLDEMIPDQERSAEIIPNDDGFIINIDGQILAAIDKDGGYSGDIDLKGMSVFGFSKNSEGIPTAILNSPDNTTETASVENLAFGESHKCSSLSNSAFAVCGGVGKYSLVANFGNGLYGLNGDEWVKLTDFADLGFSGYELSGIIATGEKEFAALIHNAQGFDLKLLTEEDISALKAKKKITLATFSDGYGLDKSVKAFNDSNENYRIELKAYTEGGNYPDAADAIRHDILAGCAPDIIQNYIGGMTVDSFGARESLFVDMYELIDKDEKISRGDFIDGYLESLDFRGKLLKISPCFNINTFAAKDKFLGGLTEWNSEEMIKIISERPEHTGIFPECEFNTRTDMLLNLVDYCSFIDYEKAECYFDSAEFINLMKQIQENEIGLTQAEFDAMMGGDEVMFFESSGNRYRFFWDDNYLLDQSYITNMESFLNIVKGKFNEPVTFIGMPNDMGAGLSFRADEHLTLSIMQSCENIDGAWEFIRDGFFSESFYHDCYAKGNLPAIEKYLDEQIEATKELTMYEDPETRKLENWNYYALDDDSKERYYYDPFTDEEAEKYGDIVRKSARCERRLDSTVYDILHEELDSYFNGERSAEESADIIQNRISIYLSENYG